jgi:hypothetical protein
VLVLKAGECPSDACALVLAQQPAWLVRCFKLHHVAPCRWVALGAFCCLTCCCCCWWCLQEIQPSGPNGATVTLGDYVRDLLLEQVSGYDMFSDMLVTLP